MNWTVVKVGGSLYDWPMLAERLSGWLHELDADRVLIVPGGGATADSVRTYDRVHGLGEEAAHWLAIQALSLNARFLRQILPDAAIVGELGDLSAGSNQKWHVLDALPFFQDDEQSKGALPHVWAVTSDSLSVRVANVLDAGELILLKSISWHGTDWKIAQQTNVVDAYFLEALKQSSHELRTRVVNLRTWQPSQKSESSVSSR